MKHKYDFWRLKYRIKEYYGNQDNFAKELNISRQSLNYKLANKVKFSYDELQKMLDLLHVKPEEIHDIFFSIKS